MLRALPWAVALTAGEDRYDASHPARWLVVHVDPARRARVDLYAWQKAYTLDQARRLARDVAAAPAALAR